MDALWLNRAELLLENDFVQQLIYLFIYLEVKPYLWASRTWRSRRSRRTSWYHRLWFYLHLPSENTRLQQAVAVLHSISKHTIREKVLFKSVAYIGQVGEAV